MTTALTRVEPVPDDPDPYANGASAYLEELLSDLTTYRYVPQVRVTPAFAKRLIDLNHENNRKHREKLSDIYARDMVGDKWRTRTGQTLKIDTSGFLVDGLHRAHAVKKSRRAIVFDLCFGVPPEAQAVIDGNAARNDADIIRIAGGADLSRSGPIVKRIWAWEAGSPMGSGGGIRASAIEVYDRYLLDPGLFDAAARRGGDCSHRNLGTSLVMGTAYFLFAKIDKTAADDFFDLYVGGVDGRDRNVSAIHQLRERMIRRQHDRLRTPEMLALCVRAWNRYHTRVGGYREYVQKLQVSRDELTNVKFPRPKTRLLRPEDVL
jgi:hypothetical protein